MGRPKLLSTEEEQALGGLLARRLSLDKGIKSLEEQIQDLKKERNNLTTSGLAVKFDLTRRQMTDLVRRHKVGIRGD